MRGSAASVFVGSLLVASVVCAGQVNVSATTDRQQIQIADPIQLTIEVSVDQGSEVAFPEQLQQLGDFDVLKHVDLFDRPTLATPNRRTWQRQLTMETLETGLLVIPSVEISVVDLNGATSLHRTEPITIEVASLIEPTADLQQFNDIAELHDAAVPEQTSSPWTWRVPVIVGSLLVIAFVATLLFRRRRSITPLQWAIGELARPVSPVPGHVERTLRSFLQDQFVFPAESFSRRELRESLAERHIPDALLTRLDELLSQTERAKFAGMDLLDDEINGLGSEARSLVTEFSQFGGNA